MEEKDALRDKEEEGKKEVDTFDLSDVEIFSTGVWEGSNTGAGGMAFSEKDLDEIVSVFNEVGSRVKPRLILGHDKKKSEEFSGYPALGWFTKLYRKGEKLYGDIKSVPKKIKEMIDNKSYGRFSPGIWKRMNINGKDHYKVLDHVALLGATLPANMSLDGFVDLYDYENNENLVIINNLKDIEMERVQELEVALANAQKENEQIKNEYTKAQEKIDELQKNIDMVSFAKKESEMRNYLEGKVKEGKITPAQMPDYLALAMVSDEMVTFEYKDGEKVNKIESNRMDLIKRIVENSTPMNFSAEPESQHVEVEKKEVSDGDKLHEKVMEFLKANPNKSYKEASVEVARSGR